MDIVRTRPVVRSPVRSVLAAADERGHPVPTGGTLDLRDATLDPAGATLRASALFGGGNLIVPEGVAMFGGWGITSEPADEEELEGASA